MQVTKIYKKKNMQAIGVASLHSLVNVLTRPHCFKYMVTVLVDQIFK